jgi:hypothetical protein
MTIVQRTPYQSILVVVQPVTQIFSSLTHRSPVFGRRRQYNHPRRERFVEESAMAREMFRL